MDHRTREELEAALPELRSGPREQGSLEWIVRRPGEGAREVLEAAQLDVDRGLLGDNWETRWNRHTEDGSPNPDQQITLMSSRVIRLLAGEREAWGVAGDQLFVDLDLSWENLPAGSRLTIGDCVLEVRAYPHTGCLKFSERFGNEALRLISSEEGRARNLRGINAKVARSGTVRRGDPVVVERHHADSPQ